MRKEKSTMGIPELINKEKLVGEEWREHPELEGLWISTDGRVYKPKSKTYNEYITYGVKEIHGYRALSYQGKTYKVHRLVAETFIPNPEGKPTVDHINMHKSDNRAENLRWATYKEQINFEDQDVKHRMRLHMDYSTFSKPVIQYSLDGTPIKVWQSANKTKLNGYCQTAIWACCHGKAKTAYGFIWKYEGDNLTEDEIKKRTTNRNMKPVVQYTLDGNIVHVWDSASDADRNGYSNTKISQCCNGLQNTHNGYLWKFVTDEITQSGGGVLSS